MKDIFILGCDTWVLVYLAQVCWLGVESQDLFYTHFSFVSMLQSWETPSSVITMEERVGWIGQCQQFHFLFVRQGVGASEYIKVSFASPFKTGLLF